MHIIQNSIIRTLGLIFFSLMVLLLTGFRFQGPDWSEDVLTDLNRKNPDSLLTLFYYWASEDTSRASQIARILKADASSPISDSLHVAISYELGQAYLYWDDFEQSAEEFSHLIEYSEDKKLPNGLALGYKGLGDVASARSKFQEAIDRFTEAEKLWQELNDAKRLGYLYNNFGVAYRKMGNNYRALQYYIAAVDQLKKVNDLRATAYISNNIGNIYHDQSKHEEAIKYHQVVLEAGEQINDDHLTATALNNLGLSWDKTGNLDKALSHFQRAYAISSSSRDNEALLLSLTNLGESLADHRQYDSAIYYLQSALDMSQQLNDTESETFAQIGLGRVYYRLGQPDLARTYLHRGLSLAQSTQQANNSMTALEYLSKVEERLGNFRSSLAYQQQFKAISDSLREIDLNNNLELLQAEYEFNLEKDKSEAQIQQLTSENQIQELQINQRNLWLWMVGIISFSSISIGYLFYSRRLVRKDKEGQDLKQKMLRIQLNPHFTYNSLNAIQSLIYEEGNQQKAADYLAQFSGLMRDILELNRHDLIPLDSEIRLMRNYLAVQQIRYDEPIDFQINVDKAIDPLEFLVPPMISQPFLENALEHGFTDKSCSWKLEVKVHMKDNLLELHIIDNGIGRSEAAKVSTHQHESLATKITKDRLRILGSKFASKTKLRIVDLYEEDQATGTQVILKLPVIYD